MQLPSFLSGNNNIKYASALGNSWCNLVSWRIVQLIQSEKLKSKYSFLHIPSTFKAQEAIDIVEELLKNSDRG